MNITQNASKTAVVISSSIIGLLTAVLPGEAATFATSTSAFSFGDFSQTPISVSTETETDTSAVVISSGEGRVINDAQASALFNQDPTFSLNRAISESFGEGSNYLGFAESQASVLGQFEILANTTFNFAFAGLLDIFTSIDDADSEQAQATAGITFALLDETANVLSSFELFGNLNTPGGGDTLFVESTANVDWTIDEDAFFSGPDELEEIAFLQVSGSYSERFTAPSRLTLVEVKASETFVSQEPVAQTPEPGVVLALLSLSGVAFSLKKRKD